jgi:hypothetical protein
MGVTKEEWGRQGFSWTKFVALVIECRFKHQARTLSQDDLDTSY